jgi:hypothetical protein
MKTLRILIRVIVCICCIVTIGNSLTLDTLKVSDEFISPIPNPTAIEWDGQSFWISNMKSPCVYKLDQNMVAVDSIRTAHARISAIAFNNADLWIAIDSTAKDTLIGTGAHKIFRAFRVNTQTGMEEDSISFRPVWVNVYDTGFVMGLAIHNDTFYVTLNAGYSSGIYTINPVAQTTKLLSYLYLSGFSFINNEILGIRITYRGFQGNWITDLARYDSAPFVLTFYATDIASNGIDLMLCDMRESKIMQIPLFPTNVKRNSISYCPINTNIQYDLHISLKGDIHRIESNSKRYTIQGQWVTSCSNSYNNHASQVSIQRKK